jgi:alpha-beta hydrolase superfamily lysophospholipase
MLRSEFKFKKFVLWGRSMGAVASLLYTSAMSTDKTDIAFQVLDSPFCSFESIAEHHAVASYKLPEVFIDIGIGIIK